MSEKIWVTTGPIGRTRGNWEYYAAADPRIKGIRDRFRNGKVDDKAVLGAVQKITGLRRIDTDWQKATEGVKGSFAQLKAFEDWVDQQPPEYRRIYGSATVIAKFITEEK